MNNNDNKKLLELVKIYKRILEISLDGFLIVDKNYKIIYINPAYCYHLDIKQEDVIGKDVQEVVINTHLKRMIEEKIGTVERNVLWEVLPGQYKTNEKHIIVTRCLVFDENKEVIGAVGQAKFINDTIKLANTLVTLSDELKYYKEEVQRISLGRYTFNNILGESKKLEETKKIARMAATNDFTVCITGETGVGKELFANAIHYESERRAKPIVRINCAAIPAELFESELFGYEEGAFTGAKKGGKKGKIIMANNGTLFLDEIGDMPLSMQAKLLRVLQEQEVEAVGSEIAVPINVRIIAATNKNLMEEVRNKRFRQDLYYRINVIQVNIPPLRERKEDILIFARNFLDNINEEYQTNVKLSKEAEKVLISYLWPGNVRELKNVIERAYTLSESGQILASHLPGNIFSQIKIKSKSGRSLYALVGEIERAIILESLERNDYNIRKTAVELDINRSSLYNKMQQYDIDWRAMEIANKAKTIR